ncbi:MAG TPA: hypothetical protein VM940_13655 [Chthoniobacterales bacterium]|jgi:hypothetical protein|nr:hypothetical protein [Chthoniobacterales bacterium]
MSTPGRQIGATIIQPGQVYWFAHVNRWKEEPVGFVRESRGGASFVGASSDVLYALLYVHRNDPWWDILCEIGRRGYVPIEIAIERSLVPDDWSPPALSDKDAYRITRIQKGEI